MPLVVQLPLAGSESVASARLSRVPRGRQSDVTRERNAERTCGAVPDALGNVGDGALILPEQLLCQRHAPREEIFHGCDADGAIESLEKCRTG